MADPYSALIKLLGAIVLIASTWVGGCKYGEDLQMGKQAISTVSATEAVERKAEAQQDVARGVEVAAAAERVRVVTKFQHIDREVIRYVQTHDPAVLCLDDDGMRIWTAANRGEFPPAESSGGGHGDMPGDASTSEPVAERRTGEPRGGDAQLPGVHDATAEPDAVDPARRAVEGAR